MFILVLRRPWWQLWNRSMDFSGASYVGSGVVNSGLFLGAWDAFLTFFFRCIWYNPCDWCSCSKHMSMRRLIRRTSKRNILPELTWASDILGPRLADNFVHSFLWEHILWYAISNEPRLFLYSCRTTKWDKKINSAQVAEIMRIKKSRTLQGKALQVQKMQTDYYRNCKHCRSWCTRNIWEFAP